jgi:hypothetical protein
MKLLFAFTVLALAPSPIDSNKRIEHKQQVRRYDDVESTTILYNYCRIGTCGKRIQMAKAQATKFSQ